MDNDNLLRKIKKHQEMLFKINNNVILMGYELLYYCDDNESKIYDQYISIVDLFKDGFNKYEDCNDYRIKYSDVLEVYNSLKKLIDERIELADFEKLSDFISKLNKDEIIELNNQIEKYNNIWLELLYRLRIKNLNNKYNNG